jgi:hypothetical protein
MQWCGRGLGAVDVAYCIAASADESLFAGGRDARAAVQGLAAGYHRALLLGLVAHGAAADPAAAAALLPAADFQVQLEWAWIDLARVAVGDHMGSITKAALEARRGQMAFNAYNKSLPVARALLEVADRYLRARESAAARDAMLAKMAEARA